MYLKKIHEIRTNHFKDPLMSQKFDTLWNKAATVAADGTVLYGVYSDYETNYKGDYTVGVYVEDEQGELAIQVNTAYKSYEVNTDDPLGVFNVWDRIWKEEEEEKITRAYTYDFEKYDHNGLISIHVAIK